MCGWWDVTVFGSELQAMDWNNGIVGESQTRGWVTCIGVAGDSLHPSE